MTSKDELSCLLLSPGSTGRVWGYLTPLSPTVHHHDLASKTREGFDRASVHGSVNGVCVSGEGFRLIKERNILSFGQRNDLRTSS